MQGGAGRVNTACLWRGRRGDVRAVPRGGDTQGLSGGSVRTGIFGADWRVNIAGRSEP